MENKLTSIEQKLDALLALVGEDDVGAKGSTSELSEKKE
jgi:hypothetical protein